MRNALRMNAGGLLPLGVPSTRSELYLIDCTSNYRSNVRTAQLFCRMWVAVPRNRTVRSHRLAREQNEVPGKRRKIICTEDHKGHKDKGTRGSGSSYRVEIFADWRLILAPITSLHSRLTPNGTKIRRIWGDLLPREGLQDSAQGFNPGDRHPGESDAFGPRDLSLFQGRNAFLDVSQG